MVENENKYILKLDANLSTADWEVTAIEQHYLPGDIRIRRESFAQDVEYTINTKSLRDDGAHDELEYSIYAPVFTMLKLHQSLAQVKKTRFSKVIQDERWSIDILAEDPHWKAYFIIAECEMPEHRTVPLHIPTQVSDNLLYAVPREHTSLYSNYRLSDKSYAELMMEKITHGS